MKANNNESGIVDATINPPRQFPSNRTSTKITMRPPSSKFLFTVPVVSAISSLRSKKGTMRIPSGKDF